MATILVADDEEGLRSFVAEALELAGHDVDQAPDGNMAYAMLNRRSYQVLVTDLKMPGLDGITLLSKIKAEQPEIEVLVMTAFGSVNTAVEAMKLGAFDYVQKPVESPAELRLLVDRALERRSLLTFRAAREAPVATPLTWGAPAMAPVLDALDKVARTNATVLLVGESGTGKEVAARAIHDRSDRHAGPFVAVNCAALSENLLESELFGHEKGSFTGAHQRRRGRLELAQGGTLFLDEVGELKPDLQAKLLRVLQEKTYERVGGAQTLDADVRWIAATNRDLIQAIEEGRFREDLYHRLAVFPIRLPPLRDRVEDLPELVKVLLVGIAAELGRGRLELDEAALARLAQASWPGNVRELKNALERAAILADGEQIRERHLWIEERGTPSARPATGAIRSLDAMERDAIVAALDQVDGNRKKAAELLGIGLRTLYDKIKRYDLK
ncbi:MAG: sigma-54-dependent Fis family transcriptional regulator [Sandaracinaceae bacterium]|nr:sigma-54-dependent Fis family transcriptional regulator [Sandaracinaceae bacterium]